jgi:hypothetical protein
MLKKIATGLICLTLLAVTYSQSLYAHKQKEAYTRLWVNPRSQSLEISHRFYLHDLEHAINKILERKADIHNNKKDQQAFTDYLQQNFQLKDSNQNLLQLNLIGYEVEGKYFWIYQEIPMSDSLKKLQVKMKVLQDVFVDQVNQVNFDKKGQKSRSLRFSSEDDWKGLELD